MICKRGRRFPESSTRGESGRRLLTSLGQLAQIPFRDRQ
jgi:hypothetical protein